MSYDQLLVADGEAPLEPDDVERLATAAYLLGRDADCSELLARAYHDHLDRRAPERAARCARSGSHSVCCCGANRPAVAAG